MAAANTITPMIAETNKADNSWLRLMMRSPRIGWALYRYYSTCRRYWRTGLVPEFAQHLLPNVYMLTNGRLTDYMADRLARRIPAAPVEDAPGVMPCLSPSEWDAALTDLRRDGIHVFPRSLDLAFCDELAAFAARTPCRPQGDGLPRDHAAIRFNPEQPIAPTYWFDGQILAEEPAVQRMLTDPTMLRLAQAYLGMEPILNIHTMWYSAARGQKPDHSSAQMFHFDLDRARFLKFFLYLMDVTEENGPHVYVKGTHVRKARALLRPDRISDDDMFSHYPKERAVRVTGPKGTVFAADTRGFHKGQALVSGNRLVFELEYVTDRYGRPEPVIQMNSSFCAAFHRWKERHPRVMCRFGPDSPASTTADLRIV